MNAMVVLAAFGWMYVGLFSLKLGGWRLATDRDLHTNPTPAVSAEVATSQGAKLRRQTHVQIAAILLIILGVSIRERIVEHRRTDVGQLRQVAEYHGGQLEEVAGGHALRIPQGASDDLIKQFSWLKNIKSIDVRGDLTDSPLNYFSCSSEIETLRIHSHNFYGHGIQSLSPLPKLKVLDLSDCQAFGSSVRWGLNYCPLLEQATFPGMSQADMICSDLAKLPALKELDLSDSDVSNIGINTLASSRSLTELNLDNTTLSPKNIATLAGLKTLGKLSLRKTKIDAKALSAASWATPTIVVVEPNRFTKQAISQLNQVPNLTIEVGAR